MMASWDLFGPQPDQAFPLGGPALPPGATLGPRPLEAPDLRGARAALRRVDMPEQLITEPVPLGGDLRFSPALPLTQPGNLAALTAGTTPDVRGMYAPRVSMPETTIGPAGRVSMPQFDVTAGPPPVAMPETTIGPAGTVTMPETAIGPGPASVPETTVAVPLNPLERLQAFQVGALGTQEERLKAERAALEGTTGQRRAGQVEALKAETEGLKAEEEQAAAETDIAIEEEQLARQQVAARRKAAESAATAYADAQKKLDTSTIDVEKAYGGTAGRLFAGLAVALGSFGASLTGGPNYAMQVVNDRINRELDAQRTELEKAKGRVSELGRTLERNERMLGDAEAARKLTTAETYRALRNNLAKSNAIQAAGPRGQMLLADLDERTNKAMAEVNARLEDVAIRREGVPVEAAAQRYAAELERRRKMAEAAAAAARSERAKEAEQRREIEKLRVKGEEERATEATKVALADGIPMQEPGAAGPALTPKQEKAVAEGQKTLVEGVEKLGIKQPIALNTTLDTLEGVLDRLGSQFEGMGGIAKRGAMGSLPPALQSQAFKEYEQAILQAFMPYKVAMTGANAPEKEMAQLEQAMGTRDPVSLRRWAAQQRDLVRRAEDTAALAVPARYRPTVLQSYRGTTAKAAAPSTFTEMGK